MKDLINSLIQELQQDTNLLAETVLTRQALEAIEVLNKMLASLPENTLFYDFLLNNVRYSVDVLASVKDNQLTSYIVKPFTDTLIGVGTNSCVYLIKVKESAAFYIGSSANVSNRISQHLDCLNMLRPQSGIHIKLLDQASVPDINWGLIYSTPNYVKLAMQVIPQYNFSLGEWQILQALSQFLPRVLEQSIISGFEPTLNNLIYNVTFSHGNWDPGLLSNFDFSFDNSLPVEVCDKVTGNVIQTIPSIARTADCLHISRNMVSRYMGSVDGFYSRVFGCIVTVGLAGVKLLPKQIVHRVKSNLPLITLPGGNVLDIIPGFVWVVCLNKTDFKGPYLSFSSAFADLNPIKSTEATPAKLSNASASFKEFCNLEKALDTEKGRFYIIKVGKRGRRASRPVHPWQ
jgi:hypothetical protein